MLSKFYTKINLYPERKNFIIRFLSNILITFFYYKILFLNKLLNGFTWHSIHLNHMKRAVDHILNNSIILSSGFTSWSVYSPFNDSLNEGEIRKYYIVEIYNYLHHVLFTLIGGWNFTLKMGPIFDNLIIFFTAIILSEIVGKILVFESKKSIYKNFFSSIFFLLFFTESETSIPDKSDSGIEFSR